jgi:hypothetical protein
MFSAFAAGLVLIITALTGVEAKTGFAGRLTGLQVLSHVGLGVLFLLLGVYFYRRLPGPAWTMRPAPPERRIRNVGAGRSPGASREPAAK